MAGAYGSNLVEKVPRVADIVSFRFKRPEAYRFQAGQWFVVTFAGDGAQEPWEHHFSHSDSPTEPWLEFTTRLRGSDFKNALNALPLGAPVQFEGPFGQFTLPGDAERVAFVVGGIGITCVRSILKWLCGSCGIGSVEAARPAAPPREIVLFFANRAEDVIPFADEIEEFARTIPGFRVVHVLSRPADTWEGYRGHVDQDILAAEIGEHTEWHFLVSGPPSFVQSTHEVLQNWSVDEARITTEQFMGY